MGICPCFARDLSIFVVICKHLGRICVISLENKSFLFIYGPPALLALRAALLLLRRALSFGNLCGPSALLGPCGTNVSKSVAEYHWFKGLPALSAS